MNQVKVKKEELLNVLRTNRINHAEIFEEALKGYRAKAVATLDAALAKARAGERIAESIVIPQPVNQTREYDRAIRMLEMSTDEEILISEEDFACYVLDQWRWRKAFLTSNSAYSAKALSTLVDEN